ncbi:MAG: porin [Luteolibacter sp.]
MKSIHCALLATSVLGTLSASAAPSGLFVNGLSGETAWDKAWSAATLYKDEDNHILQEFSLQGRLQIQSIYGKAGDDSFSTSDWKGNAGSSNDLKTWGNDIEVRRAYLGFKSKWFNSVKLEGQIDVNTDGRDLEGNDPYYGDIYDLYAVYSTSDALSIGIGKQEVKLTREQEISSKEIVTFERGNVANMLHPGNLTGLWVSGKGIAGGWQYEAAIYGADQAREFSSLKKGAFLFGKVGYDYADLAGLDTAVVSFRYSHNDNPGYQSSKNDGWFGQPTSPAFTDTISLSTDISKGRFGFVTDINYGFGMSGTAERNGKDVLVNQSDVFGITFIPTYYIADGLQLVTRFQFASSGDPNGLRAQSRYERLAAGDDETGNTYLAAYLGLNYYIYGNKLKLMNGIEYSEIRGGGNYDGYTLMTGLRMSF